MALQLRRPTGIISLPGEAQSSMNYDTYCGPDVGQTK
jgi:hypothetical protein